MPRVKQNIQSLTWCQKAFSHGLRPLYKTAVGANHREPERCVALHESQSVDAGIGAVEQSQSVGARRYSLNCVRREVGQNDITEPAHHRLVRVRLIAKTALRIKLLVLNHQGQVGHPQLQVKRFGECALILVFHQEEAGQTAVRLLGSQPMRVRVVPVGATAVVHDEVVVVTPTGCRGVDWMTIHVGGHVQAVPVNDGGLLHRVIEAGREAGATLDAQDRVLKRFSRVLGLVKQEWRFLLRQQGEAGCRGAYLQRARNVKHTQRPAGKRNEQLLLKVSGRNRIKRVGAERLVGHGSGMA